MKIKIHSNFEKIWNTKRLLLWFNFKNALKSVLWEKAIFDKRDTLENKDFYSYRENKTEKRNYTVIDK